MFGCVTAFTRQDGFPASRFYHVRGLTAAGYTGLAALPTGRPPRQPLARDGGRLLRQSPAAAAGGWHRPANVPRCRHGRTIGQPTSLPRGCPGPGTWTASPLRNQVGHIVTTVEQQSDSASCFKRNRGGQTFLLISHGTYRKITEFRPLVIFCR